MERELHVFALSIQDDAFLYVLIGQIFLGAAIFSAAVYITFRLIKRALPHLRVALQLALTFGLCILLISLVGWVSEQLQL